MLNCMGHPWHVILVGKVANIDVYRGTRLVGVWIMH